MKTQWHHVKTCPQAEESSTALLPWLLGLWHPQCCQHILHSSKDEEWSMTSYIYFLSLLGHGGQCMKTLCGWHGSANEQWLNMWNHEIISYLSSLIKPSKQQQLKNKINETPCANGLASGDFKSTEEGVWFFLLHQALFKWLSNQHAFSAASLCLVLWMKTKRAGWIARKERGLWLTLVLPP